MRIGIDARFYQEAGIGRYLRNLIDQLQKIDQENEYYIFLRKLDFSNLNFTKNFHKVLADFGWYGISEQRKFPALLKKHKLDLVHFPHFNVPVFYQGKFVVTIHDLIHFDFKMRRASTHNFLLYELKHQAYKHVMHQALRKSQKIITPSNYVKEEIVSRWDIKNNKFAVTYEGVDREIIKLASDLPKSKIDQTLEKFGIKPPFIFYVGNAHPHKNVEGLIESFLELRKNYQYLQLVLSGKDHYFWNKIKTQYGNKNIIYTGYVTDQELVALYKSAQAYVFPSLSEGFGIPLLEAMACGCPVVASNKTSLPEIGGDAAIYFDPKNQSDMVEKITDVLNNQKLRKERVAAGEKRVKEFSWQKMAEQTLEVYTKCG